MFSTIKIIFGGAAIQRDAGNFRTAPQLSELFSVLQAHDVTTIDTAQLYGTSESVLGEHAAGTSFVLDTKAFGGFQRGTATREGIVREGRASLSRLGVRQVDVFYLHSPDDTVPLESTLAGIDELHREGVFKRFGLSNFTAEDVRRVDELAGEKGWVRPSVYQGNYSPVARLQEEVLFPTLRELGMAFYAYSPIAGGFLAKSRTEIEEGAGRFAASHPLSRIYGAMYKRPAYLEVLEEWGRVAESVGATRSELAYRWVVYHSVLRGEKGDGIVFGGRQIGHVKETLEGIEHGPLPEEAVKRIDGIWEKIKHEAPLDNFNSVEQ
ncbi:aldehyde reductase [Myriangium duriaei CBS 260.36]|uniref:Aldehyde reductase n=1 Tax=Myriangium duriaei CBS 260.36 TaxID=1168546 RepID=A0A9P4IZZ3_9PEZI|nr:aldehyde reductase [Myriangium duriaei CBS 260.36]